jgi:hypothetical protein
MTIERRRRVDRFELVILSSTVINLIYLLLVALGLLRTDGLALHLPATLPQIGECSVKEGPPATSQSSGPPPRTRRLLT